MDFSKIYVNGQWITPDSKETIKVISPIDKTEIAEVPRANEKDVDLAVKAAKDAFKTWKHTPLEERVRLMEKAIEILKENVDPMAEVIAKELGCTLELAKGEHLEEYFGDMEFFVEFSKTFDFTKEYSTFKVVKEPVGVVAALTPWNYPFGQITRKITPALLTGNTIVLKPSQATPMIAYYITDAIDKAGFPKGVFNLVIGKGSEVGEMLSTHKDVRNISFTGSTSAGIRVAKNGLDDVKRATLELGGKSPCLILEGGDVEKAVKTSLGSLYSNVGQTCSALSRIVAPRSMKEEVEAAVIAETKKYKFGNPTKEGVTVGAMFSERQLEKVQSYIALGKEEGAEVLYEEKIDDDSGYYIGPVVFTEVDNKMRIAQEEIFGPVLCIVYYDQLEEGIEIANDTVYGLSSAVFGPDEIAYKVAREIDAGTVIVNANPRTYRAPFGGFKHSGIGREGGPYGLDEFVEIKTIY